MKYLLTMLIVAAVTSFTGCKDDDDVNSGGDGKLSGHVILIQSSGELLPDYSGITIEIEGTKLRATTDLYGYWEIKDVHPGILNVRVSKDSFGFIREIGYQFTGGGQAYMNTCCLGKTPTFGINFWSINSSASHIDFEVSGASTEDQARRAIFIIGPDSLLNPLDSSNFIWQNSSEQLFFDSSTHMKSGINPTNLYHHGFTPGVTYYACAYGNGWFGRYPLMPNGDPYIPSRYFEPRTQQYIYTSNGTKSNVLSFILK
ncbi:MAG: hypothetical protein ABI778_01210 [Ignavibacteriota bacterium]